jgi:hypothetical protein
MLDAVDYFIRLRDGILLMLLHHTASSSPSPLSFAGVHEFRRVMAKSLTAAILLDADLSILSDWRSRLTITGFVAAGTGREMHYNNRQLPKNRCAIPKERVSLRAKDFELRCA